MPPSLALLGMPSISSFTAFSSPSPLKPRNEKRPDTLPCLNGVSSTPGARPNSSQLLLTCWLRSRSSPRMSTELSTLRTGNGPLLRPVTVTARSANAESALLLCAQAGCIGVDALNIENMRRRADTGQQTRRAQRWSLIPTP